MYPVTVHKARQSYTLVPPRLNVPTSFLEECGPRALNSDVADTADVNKGGDQCCVDSGIKDSPKFCQRKPIEYNYAMTYLRDTCRA